MISKKCSCLQYFLIWPVTSFEVAPDALKRHDHPFSSRNLRKVSCAFILTVSNLTDLCYVREMFLPSIFPNLARHVI